MKILLTILFTSLSISVYAQADANNGWLVRGMTSNAVWRQDATIAAESIFPFITLFRTTNPGDIYGESAITAGAYDNTGNLQKQGGMSVIWIDPSSYTGWACTRLQASQIYGGGINLNFAVANFCGGHGASFFGLVPSDSFADRLNIYGNMHVHHSSNQNGRVNAEGFEFHDSSINTDTAGITIDCNNTIIKSIRGGIITSASCN